MHKQSYSLVDVDVGSILRGLIAGGLFTSGIRGIGKLTEKVLDDPYAGLYKKPSKDKIKIYIDDEEEDEEENEKRSAAKSKPKKSVAEYMYTKKIPSVVKWGLGAGVPIGALGATALLKWDNLFGPSAEEKKKKIEEDKKDPTKEEDIKSPFWFMLGAIPGAYLTHKLIRALEGIKQEKEFAREVKKIEKGIGKKSNYVPNVYYKTHIINSYQKGFRDAMEDKLDMNMGFTKEGQLTPIANSYRKGFEYVLNNTIHKNKGLIKKGNDWFKRLTGKLSDIPEMAGSAGKIIMEAPFLYKSILGSLVPLGFLTGYNVSGFYNPIEKYKSKPKIVFVKRKKKKKKKKDKDKKLEKKSVVVPLGALGTLSQILGAGYLVDLVRKSMGETFAQRFQQHYFKNLLPSDMPMDIIDKEKDKKKKKLLKIKFREK